MAIQQLMKLTGHNASIFALSQGREDHYFLSAAGDGWIVQWDMRSLGPGQLVARVGVQVFVLHFLKKINVAVAGDMNGGMHWVSLGDPAASKDIAHHKKGVYALQEANDYLFSAGGDGRLTRWAAEEFRSLESFYISNRPIRCIDFCEKRNELALGCSDNSIYLLDATTMEIRREVENAHENSVFVVRYSPDGKLLLSGGRDARLNAWSLETTWRGYLPSRRTGTRLTTSLSDRTGRCSQPPAATRR